MTNHQASLTIPRYVCPRGSSFVDVPSRANQPLLKTCKCDQPGHTCATPNAERTFGVPCPEGTCGMFAGIAYATIEQTCTPCSRGTFNSLTGQAFCPFLCPAGKCSTKEILVSEWPIPPPLRAALHYTFSHAGTYLNVTGAKHPSECKPCPVGYYCPSVATVNPKECPAGTYNEEEGAGD